MSEILGTVIVLLVVAVLAALCVRALWKGRRTGGCSGDCASCGGCPGCAPKKDKK